MSKFLSDILYSDEPVGLIDPVELTQEDAHGTQLSPLCLLGIFNLMGPTFVALDVVTKDAAPSGAILSTSLNPFGQTRLLTAKAPNDPTQLGDLVESQI